MLIQNQYSILDREIQLTYHLLLSIMCPSDKAEQRLRKCRDGNVLLFCCNPIGQLF